MGGDHKCPVCQATFTRPQHVARHMRSHTGDRPYKCQCCGDQFARSDLLARHINKCHANEKPPPNTAGGRRKGSAAASRATTSKQACDQCVQSSLPCDGSNPCSKCVSRKCRCTYVKFHRQTAPIGPGHQPPRTVSSSPTTSSGRHHLDDMLLVPPPMSVSSTVTSLSEPFLSPQFSFHPAYPQDSAVELPPISISQAAEDLSGKYRPQADLLRRAGLAAPPVSTASQAFPGIYTNQSHPNHNWCSWGDGSSGTASFFDANRGLPPLEDKDFQSVSRTQLPSAISETFDPEFYIHQSIGSGYRARRPSCDFSDSSSASQSVPSSATSSNVHLPLPGPGEVFDSPSEDLHSQQQSQLMVDAQQRDAMPSSQPSSYPGSEQQRLGQEGGFSSAFGLMTIEDQNALSNMASDGVPFFTNVTMGSVIPHSPNATPMPARQPSQSQQAPQQHYRDRGASLSALHTPGELREFWKAYMREPLSGAGSEGPTFNANNSNSQPAQMPTSPSGQRRRVRVSSLPSVTPTAERAYPLLNGLNGGQAEGSRASLHGHADDLRSYEAAVNARSTALNLNLVPRRRGTQPTAASTSPSPSVPGSGRAGAPGSSTADMGPTLSRPSSSSSASSLAHAFGPPPLSGASISLPVPSVHGHGHGHGLSTSFNGLTRDLPSRESSVASDGTGSSDGEMFRPSFKRLASQTLGPANSKRALVERGAERAGKAVAVAVTDGNGIGASRELLSASNTAPRPIAALPERARPNTAGGA